jgi:hypothetical protein
MFESCYREIESHYKETLKTAYITEQSIALISFIFTQSPYSEIVL